MNEMDNFTERLTALEKKQNAERNDQLWAGIIIRFFNFNCLGPSFPFARYREAAANVRADGRLFQIYRIAAALLRFRA